MSEGAAAVGAAAGCLFIQGSTVLAGYNPKYKLWSGIGGKIQPNESIKQAAYRETIEELFGLTPSDAIIEECIQTFEFKELFVRNNYAFIQLPIDSFIHIIYILRAHNYKSPYYNHLPTTVAELVNQRKTGPDQEITELKLVDYRGRSGSDRSRSRNHSPDISQDLLDDCIYYENNR